MPRRSAPLVGSEDTSTEYLPQELSAYTAAEAKDGFWAGDLMGIDTGCERDGFLTAVELPTLRMRESRWPRPDRRGR